MAKSKNQKRKKSKKSRKTGFKNWLNNNKIYFETVMALSLTIMSVLISIVSLSFQKKSNELQEKQVLVEAQLNMPVFNISQTLYYKDDVIDGITYPAGTEVNIINNGVVIIVIIVTSSIDQQIKGRGEYKEEFCSELCALYSLYCRLHSALFFIRLMM